jgi:competence protein ComGC
MIEVTTNYAEEMNIIKDDDEVSKSLTMVERTIMIILWPIILLMFITTLIKKDDED